MTAPPRYAAQVDFPSDLEVLVTRDFKAPAQLVFDVFTQEEHVRRTIAPYGEEVKECAYDIRDGGSYRYVFVTEDGLEMCFHGDVLEIDAPHRLVSTWFYDGWPDVEAVETIQLTETDGVTTVTWNLAFSDQAGRDHMRAFDGIMANLDNVERLLDELQVPSS